MRTILGIFQDEKNAASAVNKLKERGYDPKSISVVMQDRKKKEVLVKEAGADIGFGAASGVVSGAVVGGLTGLLIGIGAITIPGIGAVLIGGPLAAALGLTGAAAITAEGAMTGALAGGLVGALVGLGIPKNQAERYEKRIREGAILLAVPARQGEEKEVVKLMDDNGASDVKEIMMTQKFQIKEVKS